MKHKKIISLITVLAMLWSFVPVMNIVVSAEDPTYTCDFSQLVKNNADTAYGTATDIYALDEYTTAYLTYDGTYVSADGTVHITGGATVNKAGAYKQGSYIAFTAPSDGTVAFKGNRIGYCVGNTESDTYISYGNSASYNLKAGEMIFLGQRGSSYISSLTFTAAPEPTPSVTPNATPSYNEPDREVIYEEDFEDEDAGGWTSPSGSVSVKTDSNTDINKYLAVTSGKSGTARSGYKELSSSISENFVLESDIKSTAYKSNVSAFEILESKSSLYVNHGCYSNARYVFKMNRPANLNQYVINNKISDSGLSLDRYDLPAVLTNEIPDEWLHVKVIGNFKDHTVTAYITSQDRAAVYYHGRTNMSSDISSFKLLTLLAPSSGVDTCIDNIKISKALDSDLSEVFYTATINDGINEFSQYVYTGESVTNIPDMSAYGEYFLGWDVNGEIKTAAELSALEITNNVTITAKISPDYIENLASVEFNAFPAGNLLTTGPDGDTYADNEISLTIIGERGTSLVTNPDSRVTDYTINWKLDGFRTMNGNPTADTGFLYCDSYGFCETNNSKGSINFKMKNTSANYYGMVTATVTYNGRTITVSKPLLLLSDTSSSSDFLLPNPGYSADYNIYDSALMGYKVTSNDVLTGGWSISGSDETNIYLSSDNTGKYLNLSRKLAGNTSYTYQTVGDITSQTIFSQDIRYNMDATIEYGGGASTSLSSTAFKLAFASSAIKLNDTTVCSAEKGKWYHIEVIADPTTKLCFAKVYELQPNANYSNVTPLAVTDVISFKDGYTSGNFYRITLSKQSGSIDINNVKIQKAQIEESAITVTAPETVTIPDSETTTAQISVTAKSTDGNNAIGMATWEIADEFATGVAITSSDAKTAILTVNPSASSGKLPIKVTVNGVSIIKTVKLIGTKDNISFVKAPTGVEIPQSASKEYTYTAEVINGNAENVIGKTITYSLYNEDNTAPLNTEGISISSDGKLTVTSDSSPQTVCVVASSTDSSNNPISKAIKINVYSLKFDFGTDSPATGYTKVSSDLSYNDNRGFGITGTAENNEGTLIGTDFGFKVKLTKGEVYNLIVTYNGTIRCERIDSKLSGFERTKSALEQDTFQTAIFGDGILDITFSGSGELDSIVIEKVERTPNSKPAWWTIGDSTVQQNGSWGYTISSTSTTDLSKYPELKEVISAFYNSGKAGRQHRSYYTEGLMNKVLCGIHPGDVVSISGMGTNDSASSKEDFIRYNNQYIDAIEDMGGYVILGSYTPTGNYGATEGKVYDADNILFKGMRTNPYDMAIREVYEERVNDGDTKILGFIDIGKLSDNLMSNDVRTVYNTAIDEGKSASAARANANARSEELMSMWKDYNHYYTAFSNYILPSLTSRVAQLISNEEQDALPVVIDLKTATVPDTTPTPTPTVAPTPTPTATPTPTPTATPDRDNTIEVISTSIDEENVTAKIAAGFKGVAIAAMYNALGELEEMLFETDNTVSREFIFTVPEILDGYTIKLMNWNSLEDMQPLGEPILIKLEEINNLSEIEITSADEYIDVSSLTMYGNSTYRMYKSSGTYENVTATDNKVHNTTGSEVTIVPVYRFEFTNTSSSTDAHINGYVKVGASSYTEEKGYGLLSGVNYSINENGCKPISGSPIKVDVPDGFYDITLYRKGGVRCDVFNNDVQIINNTTSYGSQNRPSGSGLMEAPRMSVTDGINLTFKNTAGNNERIASVEIVRVPEKYKRNVIWIAGDSESANYYPIDADGDDLDSSKIMMTGFGMQLGKFLSNKYAIANYGQPSATVKTWYTECFESVNTLMQKGDTIIIDFGINEVASSSNGISADEMKQYMREIANAAKEKGVTPILISPVYNRKYQHKSYFTYSIASKENAMYEFAESLGIECIDLNKYTQLYANEAISVTGDENWIANNYHVNDNLHLTQHSALLAASFIAAKMGDMGYETTDFAYTYKDIAAVNTEDYTRGEDSATERIYSVAEAKKFILANTEAEPISVREWKFETDQTSSTGDNIPVISGNSAWDETNQNIKFDANSTSTGTLTLNLNPAISNNATVGFDLNIGALGGQVFEYAITDTEGNNLVSCSFDAYNKTGTLKIGNTVAATDREFTAALSSKTDDGMKASTTSFANEIDFDTDTVTVTIGSTAINGKLTGGETGSVEKIEFIGKRSKKANRSIYLDNISIKEYKTSGSSTGETAFTAFNADTYTAADTNMPYRYYLPEGYDSNKTYPMVVYLHGETRKGTDNESHMYNAQYLFNEIIAEEKTNPCILVAPQCSSSDSWTTNYEFVDMFIKTISKNLNADTNKIYLAGFNEGADGCYKLMTTGSYAAMIAISGTGDTSDSQAIANANAGVMIMNGSDDDLAILTAAKKMYSALTHAGSNNTEYVEFYGEGNNIQELAVKKEGVLSWMFSNSLTNNAEPTEKVVDLAIFMGQSNMAGRGSYASATTVPVGHGYEFRSVTNPDMLFNITGPFGKKENNSAINDNSGSGVDRRSGDMVSSIMESYYSETGVPIVGVQCSRGGTDTSYWNSSTQKTEAQSRLSAAKTYLENNGYTINHIFMIWCQGESDGDKIYSGSRSVDGYKSNTLSVFEYMKTVGVTDMFIVQTGHYNGNDENASAHDTAYVSVNEAQSAMADENDNVYTVASLLNYQNNMIDSYHYNQAAYNEVGTAAGKAIALIYSE